MTYIIRKTQRADILSLLDVERSASQLFKSVPQYAWIADMPVMTFEAHVSFIDKGLSWLAEEIDSKIILGFIVAESLEEALYIVEVSVRQSHQKQGIGSALLRACFTEAERLEKPSITLTTFKAISWNAPYYERLGFEIIGTADMPKYLQLKLENEAAAGFERDKRCAMRKI